MIQSKFYLSNGNNSQKVWELAFIGLPSSEKTFCISLASVTFLLEIALQLSDSTGVLLRIQFSLLNNTPAIFHCR